MFNKGINMDINFQTLNMIENLKVVETARYSVLSLEEMIYTSLMVFGLLISSIRALLDKKKCLGVFEILSSKSSREDMCRLPTSFLLNIQSRVKQEVDIPQIQNCVTRYSSPY